MVVRIGLIADTHIPEAGPDLPRAAYDALAGCERILHCGDLHILDVVDRLDRVAPTIVSRGNGDDPRLRRPGLPGVPDDPRIAPTFVVQVADVRIGLTHDLEQTEYRSDDAVAAILLEHFGQPVDIAVYGHSHMPLLRGLADGTALVNPGSATLPFGYQGLIGTVGFIDVDGREFEITVWDLASQSSQLRMVGPAPYPSTRGPRPVGGR